MVHLGLGIPALAVLILAQWTTNDNNLYTSSLGLSNIIPVNRSYISIAIGILGSVIGAFGIADHFTEFLSLLGIGIPPMAGIVICDYFVIRKMDYSINTDQLNSWNPSAIIAWLLGAAVGFSVKFGIASINSILAAFIAYFILNFRGVKNE